jgi:hypothetical protein
MTEEYVFKDIENLSTFNFKPNCSISFHRGKEKVGVLDFNGPEMKFSGDMDESAKLFLELVATSFKTRLEQERAEEREACAKVCEQQLSTHGWAQACIAASAIRARGQA